MFLKLQGVENMQVIDNETQLQQCLHIKGGKKIISDVFVYEPENI